MRVYLKHIPSADNWEKPKDGSNSWIDYWDRHTIYSLPKICPDCGTIITSSNPLVGAHVKRLYSNYNIVYIIPTCLKCNSQGASDNHSFLADEKLLVPANKNNL